MKAECCGRRKSILVGVDHCHSACSGIRIIFDIEVVAGIESIHCIDGRLLGTRCSADPCKQNGCRVKVLLDLAINIGYACPFRTCCLLINGYERDARVSSGRSGISLAEVPCKVQICKCSSEVSFASYDCSLLLESVRNALCAFDEDVEILNCRVWA